MLDEIFIRMLPNCDARSKLPKKRRRVLPVEQPRRKRDASASNRRVNAVKHPVVLKDLPVNSKFGVNGMNMISLALQGPSNLLRPPVAAAPLQARAPIVESPIINTQCGAISLASLQPPLMTVPPLQPRPATTGSLDLMLPLQPKLLPGYNLQSSFLSSTLSTVRPPDLPRNGKVDFYKPSVEIIVEKRESISDSLKEISDVNVNDSLISCENVDRDINVNNLEEYEMNTMNEVELEEENHNEEDTSLSKDVINSNVIEVSKVDTSLNCSSNENSPNNNSY
ncbi:jg11746 [Pararge aegeria aegeria]|uniref:Jg11746 protein n=1 Tax=Pararge aegeria aegeria TaxID=348720 RepID=A0A8S4RZR9_9NEOP|nr:jg11746 [Pararge aegeria aegeria]